MNGQENIENHSEGALPENNAEKNFRVRDWAAWVLSVVAILMGLVSFSGFVLAGTFRDYVFAGVFGSLVGIAVFIKQLRKYQGKGENDPVTQTANKALRFLWYLFIAIVIFSIATLPIVVLFNAF